MLRTVFLDAGGVLVNPNWRIVCEELGREGVRAAPERLAAAEPHAKRTMDTADRIRSSTDDSRSRHYFDLVLTHAGLDPSTVAEAAWSRLRAYHDRRNLWEQVPDEVVPSLERLRQRGLRLAVVSNANGTLKAHLGRLGLARYFDQVLDSHEEGVEKPDPRLFRIALERSRADPAETMHVGDLYHVDVVGARAAGLRAILLDPARLYADADCPRVASLSELADGIAQDCY